MQKMGDNRMFKVKARVGSKLSILIGISLLITGCAPQFIDIIEPAKKQGWVERQATATSDQTGVIQSMEIVRADMNDKVTGPDERVIWISGVDLSKSKLQRFHERIGEKNSALQQAVGLKGALVQSYQFGIFGDGLSAEGKLSLNKFKGSSADRYYVEFLNEGPMSEDGVNATMAAWKKLLPELQSKGIDKSKVILGGAKYDQKVNSIVLVKVGQ